MNMISKLFQLHWDKHMKSSTEQYLSGMGSLKHVFMAHSQVIPGHKKESLFLAKAFEGLDQLLVQTDGVRPALALICAVMNTRFKQTGLLYSVQPNLTITREFVESNSLRQLIIDTVITQEDSAT